jgi:hypothetical protein
MLALIYLAAMIFFGDRVCRYFYRFSSPRHRFATAFLVGLLLSSAITFLGSLVFSAASQPLLFGNFIFLAALALLAFKGPAKEVQYAMPRPPGNDNWDWFCLGLCALLGCWLMAATLSFPNGDFQFGFKAWSDFGANLSLAQSFTLGHNFPPTHPFFPGEPLRYHFLFWFQCANFSFLGLPLVWGVNLLSVLSLAAILILVMTLAELLFESRAVSRLSAALFFFTATSFSYIPFLMAQPSLDAAFNAITGATQFLNSGYPYRGEDWGALTANIYATQRHLISAAGLLLIVIICLIDFFQARWAVEIPDMELTIDEAFLPPSPETPAAETNLTAESEPNVEAETPPASSPPPAPETKKGLPPFVWSWEELKPLIFSGFLIGGLPYWNSAVFVTSLIVLGGVWLLFPFRKYTTLLILTAIFVGLPQVLLLRAGSWEQAGQSLFTWGYVIADPTPLKVFQYLVWTFGFKWFLLLVAFWFLNSPQRRLFMAVSILVPVVFLLQLSTDAFNNHKLLNIWNIFSGLFAAYALWRIGRGGWARRILAGVLCLAMIFGAIIDLFPVQNDAVITVPYQNDRLANWLRENTKPTDIFLTNPHLTHTILFTGRKMFLGYTLYAWTAGYNVGAREALYKQILQEKDFPTLVRMLNDNNIAYVAIDHDLRQNTQVAPINEDIFRQSFEQVYTDTENRHANLTIYRVPAPPGKAND